jgi:hypothetical protein
MRKADCGAVYASGFASTRFAVDLDVMPPGKDGGIFVVSWQENSATMRASKAVRYTFAIRPRPVSRSRLLGVNGSLHYARKLVQPIEND